MKITTLAVLLMASSTLYAETIDMKKAEENALLNNPALGKARIEIRKSREDIHLGLTNFMPQANLSYSMSRNPDTEDSSSYGEIGRASCRERVCHCV